MAPGTRATFNTNTYLASNGVPMPVNLSVQVTSDQPLVCERPLYFDADPALGTTVNGGTVAIGFTG